MKKRSLFRALILLTLTLCMILSSSCDRDDGKKGGDTPTSAPRATAAPTAATTDAPTQEPGSVPDDPGSDSPADTSPAARSEIIKTLSGGADEVGIYSIAILLSNKTADKGTVEMVYHGAKGSPQENSIVNTFRIEYEKTPQGTYEVHTFFNGEVYQNLHGKSEVKVTNTFDATLRAGDVTITYTPEDGSPTVIFSADADYFRR